ncbi:MAG: hypothetical protein ACYS1A_05120 [Planctomycetota bacterium]|jgi:hypothetical protein
MKVRNENKFMIVLVSALMLFVLTAVTHAFPPDNAALLYYRICLRYQPDKTIERAIAEFASGKTELTDQIKQFVEKNQYTVNLVLTAAEIPNCDWGLETSEGLSAPMPPLACLRGLSRLIIADAKIRAEQGDYITALEEAVSIKKMAPHVSDDWLVGHLVGYSLENIAGRCIQDILSNMPEDLETLLWLKIELINISNKHTSIKSAISTEAKLVTQDFRTEKTDEILRMTSDGGISVERDAKSLQERIRNADETFYQRNKAYYQELTANIIAILDMGIGYRQTVAKLKEIAERPVKEAQENPDATLAAVFMPALTKVYNHSIRGKTFSNAIRTAVEIYIVKARTGKLPDKLPEGLSKDLFSNKDFEYEKTADCFILRCQGKDLVRDEIYEYEFKVKK